MGGSFAGVDFFLNGNRLFVGADKFFDHFFVHAEKNHGVARNISKIMGVSALVVARFGQPVASMIILSIAVCGVDDDIHYHDGNLFCPADGYQDTNTICLAGLDPGLLLWGRTAHGHGGCQVTAVV